jgi:hypothetical protein
LQKDIAEEQADRLRLLIVVGGHGAFVAAFRNRAEIVRAHVTSISEVAALALAQRPHPLAGRCDGVTSAQKPCRVEVSLTNRPTASTMV